MIDAGKEAEDLVEVQLQDSNIPYKRNVKFTMRVKQGTKYRKEIVTEFDYIIPGAIIEVKTAILNNHRIDAVITQLKKQLSIIPKNFTIYLFSKEPIKDNNTIKLLEFNTRIKILATTKDITIVNLPIIVDDTRCLKSFASLNNSHIDELLKFNKIHTYRDKYNKIYSLATEEELQQLKKFSFILQDENILKKYPDNYIIVSNKKWYNQQFEKRYLFKVFFHFIDYHELQNKYPIRSVEGTSSKCSKCNKLYLEQFINESACFKCLGLSLPEIINANKKRKHSHGEKNNDFGTYNKLNTVDYNVKKKKLH